jgi:hypothetical protein
MVRTGGWSERVRALVVVAVLVAPVGLSAASMSQSSHVRAARSDGSGAVSPVADPAARYAAGSPAMQTAQSIAGAYWGQSACGGQVSVDWTAMDPDTNAFSSWSVPGTPTATAADYYACHISFNSAAPFDWPKFCTIVVHEYGHLTGHQHVADPADVMTPIYSVPVAPCAQTADPSSADAAPDEPEASPDQAPISPRAMSASHHRRTHRRHCARRRHRGLTVQPAGARRVGRRCGSTPSTRRSELGRGATR